MRAISSIGTAKTALKPCTRGKTCRTPFHAGETHVLFTTGFASQFPTNRFRPLHDAEVTFAGIVGPERRVSRSQNVRAESVAVEDTDFRPWPGHEHVNQMFPLPPSAPAHGRATPSARSAC